RLDRAGAQTRMEEELFYDGYARQLLPFGLACLAAGVWSLIGRRRLLPAVIAAAATAALIDDVSNGERMWRKLVTRPKRTWNVVAHAGDPAGERTLVVLAHH